MVVVFDLLRGFLVDMDNFGVGDVGDLIIGLYKMFGLVQVFQVGQVFVVGIFLLQVMVNGGIGVVIKGSGLGNLSLVGELLGKDLMFGKLGLVVVLLFVVVEGNLGIGLQGGNQLFKLVLVNGIDVGIGKNQIFIVSLLVFEIEGVFKGKVLGVDVDELNGIVLGNVDGGVG